MPLYLWIMVAYAAFVKSYTISINFDHSLPGTLFLIQKQEAIDPKVGQLAAFLYSGKAFYRKDTTFVKIVKGKSGSVVEAKQVEHDIYDYFVDGAYIGRNKLFSQAGVPIKRAKSGVIPQDHYFMSGTHSDSLDSRYEVVGWVPRNRIIGLAYRIF